MWLWISLLLALAAFAVSAYYRWEQMEDEKWGPHVPNQLIVKFRDGVSAEQVDIIHRKAKCRVLDTDDDLGICWITSKRKMRKMLAHYQKLQDVEFAEPNYLVQAFYTPNDPFFASYQYGLQRIQAPSAWDVQQGKETVKIAIVDTGVQLDHPDLRTKLVPGYNFVENNAYPYDRNGHGTHVAGIAAAATNNGAGIAGVAPRVMIMPVKVLDDSGSGEMLQVARGITYAANQGAKVINLSLGSPYSTSTLQSAVQYAWERGAVIVAAAGNDGTSTPNYPADYPNVIAVASTNERDGKSGFANFGRWVEVAAPGEEILSTYTGGYYAYLSGTSMAAPHVAGVAALMASQGRPNVHIRLGILSTADPIAGTGTYWQYGRVNAARAVRY